MKHASQHRCDNPMNDKMTLYREFCFRIVQNHGEQSYFRRF